MAAILIGNDQKVNKNYQGGTLGQDKKMGFIEGVLESIYFGFWIADFGSDQ